MSTNVIANIRQTIELLRSQQGNIHGSQEQRWIQAHLDDERLGAVVLKLSIVAFHTLSALETGA